MNVMIAAANGGYESLVNYFSNCSYIDVENEKIARKGAEYFGEMAKYFSMQGMEMSHANSIRREISLYNALSSISMTNSASDGSRRIYESGEIRFPIHRWRPFEAADQDLDYEIMMAKARRERR